MSRYVKVRSDSELDVEPCPKCGNKREFNVHSSQCAEDACEVYAVCVCGHDPTFGSPAARFESVMGGTDALNCICAIEVWTQVIRSAQPQESKHGQT